MREPDRLTVTQLLLGTADYTDFDCYNGWRDTGKHRFEFALLPHCRPVSAGELTRLGYAYNLPVPLAPPFTVRGDGGGGVETCAQ